MTCYLEIENEKLEIEEAFVTNEDALRELVAAAFPAFATATFERKEEGGHTVIKALKKAGSNGLDPVQFLIECPEQPNPAINLTWQLKQLDRQGKISSPHDLLPFQSVIAKSVEVGTDQDTYLKRSLSILQHAPAIASNTVPIGF